MKGTLINCGAVLLGTAIGLIFKKGIKERYRLAINKALGAAIFIVGLNGVISNMFSVQEDGSIASSGEVLLIVSMVVGTFLGEALRIEDRLNGLSLLAEKKLKMKSFALGFTNASVLFCVGAMAIVGAVNDGISGDSSILIIKSMLDFITSVILCTTMGAGVGFAVIPVLLYQGGISLLSAYIGGFLSGEVLKQISMVGYTIIVCIGFNFFRKDKFKTANMLPAMLVPIVYQLIRMLYKIIIR